MSKQPKPQENQLVPLYTEHKSAPVRTKKFMSTQLSWFVSVRTSLSSPTRQIGARQNRLYQENHMSKQYGCNFVPLRIGSDSLDTRKNIGGDQEITHASGTFGVVRTNPIGQIV